MSFFSLQSKNLKREINRVFFVKFFKKPLCNLTGTHEMGKFKTVNELVNSLNQITSYIVYGLTRLKNP